MPMTLPPWLAQSANPAQHFQQGVQIGAQIGEAQARQQLQQEQMLKAEQEHAVDMARRAIEFSLSMKQKQAEMGFEREKLGAEMAYKTAALGAGIERAQIMAAPREEANKIRSDEMARRALQQQGLQEEMQKGTDMPTAILKYPEAVRGVSGIPAAIRAQQANQPPQLTSLQDPITKENYMVSTYAGSQRQLYSAAQRPDSTFGPRIRSLQAEAKTVDDKLTKDWMGQAAARKPLKDRTDEEKGFAEQYEANAAYSKKLHEELANMRNAYNSQSKAADMTDRLNAQDAARQAAMDETEDIDLGDDFSEGEPANAGAAKRYIWDPNKNMAVPVP